MSGRTVKSSCGTSRTSVLFLSLSLSLPVYVSLSLSLCMYNTYICGTHWVVLHEPSLSLSPWPTVLWHGWVPRLGCVLGCCMYRSIPSGRRRLSGNGRNPWNSVKRVAGAALDRERFRKRERQLAVPNGYPVRGEAPVAVVATSEHKPVAHQCEVPVPEQVHLPLGCWSYPDLELASGLRHPPS